MNINPSTIPGPLRGSEPGSFAESTIKIRLKGIGQRIIQENSFSAQPLSRMIALVEDLPNGKIRWLEDHAAPDHAVWQEYIQPYLGMSWLEVPWFFAETYFYRRVLEATGYFGAGDGVGVDPYAYQKRLGLLNNQEAVRAASGAAAGWLSAVGAADLASRDRVVAQCLDHLIALSLWGNQADLSMWPAGEVGSTGSLAERTPEADGGVLLVDNRERIRAYVFSLERPRLDLVLDNSGLELVHDLLSVKLLLQTDLAGRVVLHVKAHPTFVSDAVREDVLQTVQFLRNGQEPAVIQTGEFLQAQLDSGRLAIRDDFYWNSPLAFWDAPHSIERDLTSSQLVISKGDANYRRFLGDRHWAFNLPAKNALGYLPFPYLALRVCKSEVAVGLQAAQMEALSSMDADWMVNGTCGMIQYVSSGNQPHREAFST